MNSLIEFFEQDFNTQQEQWEKAVLAELKLNDLGNKTTKRLLSGSTWPTLSLKRKGEVQLEVNETWKKASTTYIKLDLKDVASQISEDLNGGVRNWFIDAKALDHDKWKVFQSAIHQHAKLDEIEVFILGETSYQADNFKVITNLISGRAFHDQGAHSIQELALMAKNLIHSLGSHSGDIYLGIYVDSHFFHNIAKLRAAKLIASKILAESKREQKIIVVALTSFVGWTLFERYSNMLRNETAVASAYIAGADHVQSAGYNSIMELEAVVSKVDDHTERSHRMARNTSHVLALESMLGIVEDAAYGSFHLENLTSALCEDAWKLMQQLLSGADISMEISEVREKRLEMIKTRRSIVSGTNDYPDVKEQLHVELKSPSLFRTSRIFEELRLRMEKIPNKPDVYVALYGEYSSLNGRINFVKNYFELLGISVLEPGHSELNFSNFEKDLISRTEKVIVLCALDENYPQLLEALSLVKAPHKYLAGKYLIQGYKNLFAGQNIYEVLENLVSAAEGVQS